MKRFLIAMLLMLLLLPWAAAEEVIPADAETIPMEAEAVPMEDEAAEEQIVIEDRPLTAGDFGEDVAMLQLKLSDLCYYDGEITGSYGDLTTAAVSAFQADYGMKQTGSADIATQTEIYAAKYRPLRLGCMGEDVRLLQARLNALGYFTGKISGTYMPATQEAVALFQRCMGEIASGEADLDTLHLLYGESALPYSQELAAQPVLTPTPAPETTPVPLETNVPYTKKLKYEESSGPLVKQLQTRLTELGYYSGNISGNFLGNTRNAVKAFQEHNALDVDGVVGENTWNALFNDPDVRGAGDMPKPTPEPTPIPYAITVDVTNQVTTVYGLDENGEYTQIVRQMLCSTGTKSFPSDVGDWVLTGRNARWCYFPKWGGHAQFWTKINGSIAFHSVIYSDPTDTMSLSTSSYKNLGKRASHGCIRLTVADARWIYNNIGAGVVVTITEDLPADPELRHALKLPGLDYSCMLPIITPAPTAAPEYVTGMTPDIKFRTLKKNSSGEDVYFLQCKLTELGYYAGHIGGVYLDGTAKAVKAFQKEHGLDATGTANAQLQQLLYAQQLATPTPEPTAIPTPTFTAVPMSTPVPTPTPAPAPTAAPQG